MSKVCARVFSREFKEAAVRRILAGERIAAIAADLGIRRKLLYDWRNVFRAGGSLALRPRGRPRREAGSGISSGPAVGPAGPAAGPRALSTAHDSLAERGR